MKNLLLLMTHSALLCLNFQLIGMDKHYAKIKQMHDVCIEKKLLDIDEKHPQFQTRLELWHQITNLEKECYYSKDKMTPTKFHGLWLRNLNK